MTTLADSMRAIRAWHIVVLVAVPFIVAGIVYGSYTVATRDADDGLAEDQQLIPVQRGDLVNDVSINGSLAYSERETLTFGSQGALGRIEVEAGQVVAANEVLATLDDPPRSDRSKKPSPKPRSSSRMPRTRWRR